MGITVRNVSMKAHHLIGQIEKYHRPFCRIYSIIAIETPGVDLEAAFQMAFKAINNSVGPNGLVPTLLVFGAHPRMIEMDAPSPTITQRAIAMRKAMDEVKRLTTSRQVNDALNTRNGPSTASVHDLPLNSDVLVFRESKAGRAGSWKGLYKLIGLEGEQAIVELTSGPTRFRTTSVKGYNLPANGGLKKDNPQLKNLVPSVLGKSTQRELQPDETPRPNKVIDYNETDNDLPEDNDPDYVPSTASSANPNQPVKRGWGRPQKHAANANTTPDLSVFFMHHSYLLDGSKSAQFVESRQKEVLGLIEKGVFQIADHSEIPTGARIFNSRFVDEIKNQGTEKAYEKSRLVVQAYNDINKANVLTQFPTI